MDEKEVSEMQEEMMTVLVVEPMKAPYVKNIPNELEDLQQAVGGDIEMTYPFDDKVGILLNGNGKFEGLPLNRALYDDHGQVYDVIAGTFLVVGLTEDDFTSLTPEQIEKFKEKYQSPEIFNLFNGELHVMKMPPQEQKEQEEKIGHCTSAAAFFVHFLFTKPLQTFHSFAKLLSYFFTILYTIR